MRSFQAQSESMHHTSTQRDRNHIRLAALHPLRESSLDGVGCSCSCANKDFEQTVEYDTHGLNYDTQTGA